MSSRGIEALVRNAVAATGATAGWLLGRADDGLRVVAYCGPDDPARFLGMAFDLAGAGSAGLALASGQPMAVRPRADDALVTRGPMALLARPPGSYVTVPCGDDDGLVGVLEVVDKQGAAAFDIDDVELLSLLGDIAAALQRDTEAANADAATLAPGPGSAGDGLDRLARHRPAVHRAVMDLIATLEEV